jgi:hypothetical protein
MTRVGIACASLLTIVLVGASTYAQPPDATHRALAESLFREARERMQAHDYAAACPKLEESQRLDPAVGTLLNLAVCHSALGKVASAWAEFNSAADEARLEGDRDREQLARRHASELEPRLSYVVLRVRDHDSPGEPNDLRVDDVSIGRAAWGAPLPLDPGVHRVEARAPGRRPWKTTVTVVAGAPRTPVEVPPLESEQSPSPAPPVEPAAPERKSDGGTQRAIAYSVIGLGAAGLAVGAAFGVRVLVLKRDRADYCDAQNVCSADGVSLDTEARSAATASTIAFAGGAAVAAAGFVLALTAPRSSVSVVGGFAPGGGPALRMEATW